LLRNRRVINAESQRNHSAIAAWSKRIRRGSRHAITPQSLRNHRKITAQSLHNQNTITAQSLRNRCAIAPQRAQTLHAHLNLYETAAQSVPDRYAIKAHSPRQSPVNHSAITPQSLRNHSAITTQPPRTHCAIAAQSLRNRTTNEAQTLHRPFSISVKRCAIGTQLLCNRFENATQTLRNRYANIALSMRYASL
jgi:hypothetical protein